MSSESLAPQVLRRIAKEAYALQVDPPEGIRVIINEDDIADVKAWVRGPNGTCYEGGYFKVKFSFGSEYPAAPPKCYFLTKLFHPNVAPAQGSICVNTLKKDWCPRHTLTDILLVIKCLLIYPNPESALDEEAGRLFMENWKEWAERAKLVTGVHARVKPREFEVETVLEREARSAPVTSSSTACAPSPSCVDACAASSSSVPLVPSVSNNGPLKPFSTSNNQPNDHPSIGSTSSTGPWGKKRSLGMALGTSAAAAGGGTATGENAKGTAQGKRPTGAGAAKKRGLRRL